MGYGQKEGSVTLGAQKLLLTFEKCIKYALKAKKHPIDGLYHEKKIDIKVTIFVICGCLLLLRSINSLKVCGTDFLLRKKEKFFIDSCYLKR